MIPDEKDFKDPTAPLNWMFDMEKGLFWKEIEENFAISYSGHIQEHPENYLNDVFAVKLYELSNLPRYHP